MDIVKDLNMIIKANESKNKKFKGLDFEVLAVGEKSMATKMNYKNGEKVPMHSHPNEQSGYVISGKYIIKYGEIEDALIQGDTIL